METVKKLMNSNKIRSSVLLGNSSIDYVKIISDKVILIINKQLNSKSFLEKNCRTSIDVKTKKAPKN